MSRLLRTVLPALLLVSAAVAGAPGAHAASSSASEELAECLYKNTSSADRTTFLQWAYVSLGRTQAAKSVQPISTEKTKAVEKKAQTALTRVVMSKCPKPAMNVLLTDPKKGLERTLTSLAGKLVSAEVEKRTSPLLSLSITDILGK